MRRRLAAVVIAFCGAWLAVAGCTAAGSTSRVNGPAYDLEASAVGEGDALVDTGALTEAASALEGGAPTDAPIDGDALTADGMAPRTAADAGEDAGSVSDAGIADACAATTVIVGGNDLSLFGAMAIGQGPFMTDTLTGSVAATPAIVAFAGGFEGLVAEATDADGGSPLFGVGFASGAWSVSNALGGSAATIDAPAVAAVGSTLQGVYLNPEHFYFHASFGTGWNAGTDPVRPPNDAGGTAFGPVRAAAAGTATEFVVAYEGNDLLPYAQAWTSAAGWDDGTAIGSSVLLTNTAMAIAALDGGGGGGASDLVAVYVDGEGSASTNNLHLFFSLRSAATKAWSSPAIVDVNAFTTEPPALTSLSAGRALLAWRGQSGGVYGSVLVPGATPAWSTPAPISAATSSTTPSLAAGTCGDDAVAAYVSLGSVYTARLTAGTWTAPALVAGPAGVTRVAIATAP